MKKFPKAGDIVVVVRKRDGGAKGLQWPDPMDDWIGHRWKVGETYTEEYSSYTDRIYLHGPCECCNKQCKSRSDLGWFFLFESLELYYSPKDLLPPENELEDLIF